MTDCVLDSHFRGNDKGRTVWVTYNVDRANTWAL